MMHPAALAAYPYVQFVPHGPGTLLAVCKPGPFAHPMHLNLDLVDPGDARRRLSSEEAGMELGRFVEPASGVR